MVSNGNGEWVWVICTEVDFVTYIPYTHIMDI